MQVPKMQFPTNTYASSLLYIANTGKKTALFCTRRKSKTTLKMFQKMIRVCVDGMMFIYDHIEPLLVYSHQQQQQQ